MTLVCVRLENSYGVQRLTALADTRATIRRDDGTRKVISDTTKKLFALPVRCYPLDLVPVVGAWRNPYFETTIGLGFSGSCFEALTVVAHLTQSLSALVSINGDDLLPTRDGLVNLTASLCDRYFAGHSGDGDPILRMLIFGFDNQKPWISRIQWDKASGLQRCTEWATDETLMSVGETPVFEQYAKDWRQRIEAQKSKLESKRTSSDPDGRFKRELQLAQLDIAERKATEHEMLRQIESEFAQAIGGVLQRMELARDGDLIIAGFTQDDSAPVEPGYSVASNGLLAPISIFQKMGKGIRTTEPLPSQKT